MWTSEPLGRRPGSQPLSVNSYTNKFTFQIREDLIAGAKVNWFYLMGPYADLWGSDILGRPHVGVDAGLKYFPMNNGIIDIEARTHHNYGSEMLD